MDVGLHELAHRGKHHSMPLDTIAAGESLGHDGDTEMSTATCRSRVARMRRAVVKHFDELRRELPLDRGANFRHALRRHDAADDETVSTLWTSQKICAPTKMNVTIVSPKTLKLTQKFWLKLNATKRFAAPSTA